MHQGKGGRKKRSDWQIKEIFLHKSIISCKHQYFTVFCPFWFSLPLLIIFTVILQASTCFLLLLFFIIYLFFFFQASTSDLSIQKENNETAFTIEQFPMQMTHKHNKWLQILAEGDFPPKRL